MTSFALPGLGASDRDVLADTGVEDDVEQVGHGYDSATFTAMSHSKRFEIMADNDDVEHYTGDIYSFMALYSPFTHPKFFFFGFGVFCFQISFLMAPHHLCH